MIPNFDSGLQLALTLQSGLPPGAASALVSDLSGPVVVAAALVGIGMLMAALRRTGHERRMVWGSSLAILLVGLALFVERVWH